MQEPETKENPAFLEYVYKLTEGTNLHAALELSLKKIEELDIDKLKRIGYQMPLYVICLTIAAHQIHHFNIIEERYFPLHI